MDTVEARGQDNEVQDMDFVEPWKQEDEPLPASTAQKLRDAANEFDMAAILDALQPLRAWEVTGRTDGNFGKACGRSQQDDRGRL